MANIASKNVFDVLGNDADEGSEAENTAPARAVEKSLPRTTKRNAPDAAPSGPRAAGAAGERGGRGGRRGGDFGPRDKNAGDASDRFKSKDDGLRADRHPNKVEGGHVQWSPEARGGRGSRGGRGGRGIRDDRHSRTGRTDTEKEVSQGWGSTRGDAEWQDEKAGEAIAQAEEKEAGFDAAPAEPVDGEGHHPGEENAPAEPTPEAEPEPEDNTRSYADYLAEQASRKLDLGTPEARKPNESAKQDKKWAQAKELKRDEDDDAFIAGTGPKAKRERQRKERTYIEIEQRPIDPPRGGREGGRGGRGRGEGRGDFRGRGRGAGRGGPRGRGEGRGGGGGGGGGGGRGSEPVDVADPDAFPTLGGS